MADIGSTLVPIYRHEAGGRYYLDALLENDSGWSLGVIAFRAHNNQQPETIAIYRHTADGQYYYDKQISGSDGWGPGEVAFYAYPTQQPGTIPIYQHRVPNTKRYYYDTQSQNDWGWSEQLLAFYAFPPNTTFVDDTLGILGQLGAKYYRMTYQTSSDNTFTLLDTPRLWDQSPQVQLPIPGCEKLLSDIQSTIESAQFIVDITTLFQTGGIFSQFPFGFPSGGFQEALSEAFLSLSRANRRPFVRIMMGIPFSPTNAIPTMDLTRWLRETVELDNRQKITDLNYSILVGCSKQSPESWNHSKIVAADGVRAVVGGHNMWATDYLDTNPVHDVSGLIEGSVVSCVHNFCDELWTRPSVIPIPVLLQDGKLSTVNGTIKRATGTGSQDFVGSSKVVNSSVGTTRMLSVGRLGFGLASEITVATNASVSTRVMAICRAKQSLRISQQSLYFTATHLDGGFDLYTLWAIVKSIQAGVNVQIVVSNDVPLADGGYDGDLPIVLGALATLYVADKLGLYQPDPNPTRDQIDEWARASLNSPATGLPLTVSRLASAAECAPHLNELNSKLSVALLYYAPDVNYWQVGSIRKLAANHAKVYIIDDTHFYVGSDNFYLSGTSHGLQEYGHLIEGQSETQQFITDYWDKLWKNSGPHAVKATFDNVSLALPIVIPPFVP